MRSKKFTITSAQLNTGDDVINDIYLTDVSSGTGIDAIRVERTIRYPHQMYVKNATGDVIEFTCLASGELTDYYTNPTNYAKIPLGNNDVITFTDWNLPQVVRLIVAGTATHSADLEMTFINYI